MLATTWLKDAAVESYITLFSRDGRRIRSADIDDACRCRPSDDRAHVRAALNWLCRAHDVGTDDGVSAMYSLMEGWTGSYPEVTGYIVPTFYDAAELLGDEHLASRAAAMTDWLLSLQLSNGAFPGSFVGRLTDARVFNTGQVIFGLIRTAEKTGQFGYLEAATRAGDWLVSVQDANGCWTKSTLNGIPHTYNVRTAWSLARLAEVTGESRFYEAAIANATWAVRQQYPSGWFVNNAFVNNCATVSLHTLCYCMRGLLEIGAMSEPRHHESADMIASATRAADALLAVWKRDGNMAGTFDAQWSSPDDWRCIPGEAQLAIVWMRLYQISGEDKYRSAAVELLDHVKSTQFMEPDNLDLDGGLSGSLPINAPYERYCLVSWGSKFLIDALILKGRASGEHPIG